MEYLGKTLFQVKKQLKEIFQSYQKNVKLNVDFKSSKIIKNTFGFKDILPKHINSKVLCNFKCHTSNSVYIDKTKQHLLVRQYEHLGLSVLAEKALKYREKDATGMRKYCYENKHRCSKDNFQIVVIAVNDFHLKLKKTFFHFKNEAMFKYRKRINTVILF